MKRIIILIALCIMAAGCSKSLYYWGRYEDSIYKNFKKQTPESICNLIAAYEDMIANPGGIRNVPPPGICAEYAYLLSKPETAEIFAGYATASQKKYFSGTNYEVLFADKAKELFEMEMNLYPESATFLVPIKERSEK